LNVKQEANMNYQIEPLQPEDWPQVRSIYAESIKTGIATFDTKPPNWKDWGSVRLLSCRFVAREGKKVFGWATLSPAAST
jgi:phosphinothricin acetyltransferase